MIRVARTFLLLTALAGFLPQMGAAATACRSGVMSAQDGGQHSGVASMEGMAGANTNGSDHMNTGLPCSTPNGSHDCSLMAPCSIATYTGMSAIAGVDPSLPECPASVIVSQPSSRTLLPELPPPRA